MSDMFYAGDASPVGGNPDVQWLSPGIGIANFNKGGPNVAFLKHALHDVLKSQELGRPYYKETDFVRIQHPGERDVLMRKVQPDDPFKYPAQWAAYKQNKDQIVQGTPIELLCPANPAIAGNLRASGFNTVEQLSTATAQGLASLGPHGQTYVIEAQRYLDSAKRGVDHHEVNKALADRDSKIKTQDQQISSQQQQINQLQQQLNNVIGQLSGNQNTPYMPQMKQPQQAQQPTDFGLPPPPFTVTTTEEPVKEPNPNRRRARV